LPQVCPQITGGSGQENVAVHLDEGGRGVCVTSFGDACLALPVEFVSAVFLCGGTAGYESVTEIVTATVYISAMYSGKYSFRPSNWPSWSLGRLNRKRKSENSTGAVRVRKRCGASKYKYLVTSDGIDNGF
jgi:hypothetical protein